MIKLTGAFLRLIRYPNLIFIFLTQYLLQYAVLEPVLKWYGLHPTLGNLQFFLLSGSTALVAASGYIINDYFDINIDLVNRPHRIIVDRLINRRWAIAWHTLFNIIAVALGFEVAIHEGNLVVGFIQPLCTGLLWFYSTSYKRQLVTGNLVIALLTALTVLVIGFYEPQLYHNSGGQPSYAAFRLIRIMVMYAVFAFLISLVREIVKDLEDQPGDAKEGCRTIPIVWGIHPAKNLCYGLTALLVLFIIQAQYKLAGWGWYRDLVYLLVAVEVPLIITIRKLARSVTPRDFHSISNLIKLIMLTGIFSMIFFYIN